MGPETSSLGLQSQVLKRYFLGFGGKYLRSPVVFNLSLLGATAKAVCKDGVGQS